MFAAVDLGSNSFRLHVGTPDGTAIRIVRSARDPVRLGAGLDRNNRLTPAAIQSALASLRGFAAILGKYKLEGVRVVATNALRMARNAASFVAAAEAAIGYPVEIISGEEEGRLIYLGVAAALGPVPEKRLVIDIGGGSTELVLGMGPDIVEVASIGIGTVRKNAVFFADGRIDAAAFAAAVLAARSYFEDVPIFGAGNWDRAYGSSGTSRAVGDAIQRNGIGDGQLSRRNLDLLRERLIEYGRTDRISLIGMKPDRANVICGGVAILIGLMEELEIATIAPVQAGLRMGVIWDLALRATSGDRRERAVQSFSERFQVNLQRAALLAEAAVALYAQIAGSSRDAMAHAPILKWSARLHGVGMALSHTGYHKHGAYMIESADLPGFTATEKRRMALLVLGQKGSLRKLGNALDDADFMKSLLALRLAVMLMHAHEVDATDALRLRVKGKVEIEIRKSLMGRHPTLSWSLARERSSWEEVGISFSCKTF